MSIDGLRSVPLDILKRLEAVPEAYLQELGEDHDLFAELPASVQQQVRPVHLIHHASLYHIVNWSAVNKLVVLILHTLILAGHSFWRKASKQTEPV